MHPNRISVSMFLVIAAQVTSFNKILGPDQCIIRAIILYQHPKNQTIFLADMADIMSPVTIICSSDVLFLLSIRGSFDL